MVEGTDVSAMLFHNAVADRETKATAFADLLSCIKRIEDFLGISESGPGVPKLDINLAISRISTQAQDAALRRIHDRIDGVIDYVEKDLLQLMGIADYKRKLRVVYPFHSNVIQLQIRNTLCQRVVENTAQIQTRLNRLALT